MRKLTYSLLYIIFTFLQICHANSTSSFNMSIKADQELIQFQIQNVYERYLETERETCSLVYTIMQHLTMNIRLQIDITLSEVWESLHVFKDVMDPKKGICINETVENIRSTIDKEITEFKNVAQVTEVKLKLLTNRLVNDSAVFESNGQKTIDGLNNCYYDYPNGNQEDNRDKCIQEYKEFFNRNGDELTLTYSYSRSPCMKLFQDDVLSSIYNISIKVRETTEQLLDKLRCTDDDSEGSTCITSLPKVPSFEPSVLDQVNRVQTEYNSFYERIETSMTEYQTEEYEAKRKYDIKPQSQEETKNIINSSLEPKSLLWNEMLMEYPDHRNCYCGEEATRSVSECITIVAHKSTECFNDLVKHVINTMEEIRKDFLKIAMGMQNFGNVNILKCIGRRNIFVESAISNCQEAIFKTQTMYSNVIIKSIREKQNKLDSLLPYLEDNGRTLECMVEERDFADNCYDIYAYFFHECLETCRMEAWASATPSGTSTIKDATEIEEGPLTTTVYYHDETWDSATGTPVELPFTTPPYYWDNDRDYWGVDSDYY